VLIDDNSIEIAFIVIQRALFYCSPQWINLSFTNRLGAALNG
jgi:hypothetical protein